MTYLQKAVLIILALTALLTIGPRIAGGEKEGEGEILAISTEATLIEEPKPVVPRGTTDEQEAWLKKLERCESSGNPEAINEVDRDGTASYGLLQFKPSTFEAFAKAYGIEGELMDPDAQRAIVRRMMSDPSVDWEWQFPDCVKLYIGHPPAVLH